MMRKSYLGRGVWSFARWVEAARLCGVDECMKSTDKRNQYELNEPATNFEAKAALGKEEAKTTTAVPENELSITQKEKADKARRKAIVVVKHIDIIKDDFWERRPWIVTGKPGKPLAVRDQ